MSLVSMLITCTLILVGVRYVSRQKHGNCYLLNGIAVYIPKRIQILH